jgi:putative hydrolase of the HAD superfamily
VLKAVLFDYGGTLDSDGIPWLDRFFPIYQQAGLAAPWEEFRKAFYDSDDQLPERYELEGLDLERTVGLQVRCVVDRLAPSLGAGERGALAEAVTRKFVDDSRRQFARNRPLLERLAAGYRLGVVSNFYGNLEGILQREGLESLFGAVADSQRVGCLKPDKEIFLHAARELGTAPEECLMVGDSLHRDMKGAENAGMPHAWLAGDRPDRRPCCPGTPVLKTFQALEAALPKP